MLKGNRIFVTLAAFLLFLPCISAKIHYLEVYTEIDEKGRAVSEYTLVFQKNEKEREVYIFPENLKGEKFTGKGCRMVNSRISCLIPKGKKVEIKFRLEGEVRKVGEKNLFEENLRVSESVENMVFVVKLPEGAVLPENGIKFMPSSGIVGSDGRRIILAWEKSNLEAGEIYGVRVYYEFLKEAGRFNFAYAAIPFGAVALLALYLFYSRRKTLKRVILPVLREDEKRVMEIVLKYPRGVNQKVIVKESNYSKAKVSKVLKSLAERGLVRIERRGRSNMVYLLRDFEKR